MVDTCAELDWSTLQNGELLSQAEAESYDAFITTDQNLRYQQDLASRAIRILVLKTTSWPRIRQSVDVVLQALEALEEGGYVEVDT